MSRNVKTTFKVFDYMHCDDFARYLEQMAAKGWHFKEWGAGLKFEKGEPQQVKYAVEVFTKASENDLRPEPNTQEFAEYCEAAGWKLVDAKQKFCIFKKIDANAVEILTPEERVKNAFKGTVSIPNIILLILYGMNVMLQWSNMNRFFSDNIFSSMGYFNVAIWAILFLTLLVKMIYGFVKRQKLLRQIRCGEKIYIGSDPEGKKRIDNAWAQWFVLFFMFVFMVFMLEDIKMQIFMVSVFVITILFSVLLAKFRPDTTTNIMIQIVYIFVFFVTIMVIAFTIFTGNQADKMTTAEALQSVPLKITDYREWNDEVNDVSIYHEKNSLGSRENYFIFGKEESIHYEIYRTEHAWILERIWEDELEYKWNDEKADCTAEWDAEIAFRNTIGEYYVRYDDILLILSEETNVDLDADQISIIREKLDLR